MKIDEFLDKFKFNIALLLNYLPYLLLYECNNSYFINHDNYTQPFIISVPLM